jgi:hypothetical protein
MREHIAVEGDGARDVRNLSAQQQKRVQLRLKQLVITRRSMLTMGRAIFPIVRTKEYADVVSPDVVWVDGNEAHEVADMIPTFLRKGARAAPMPFEAMKNGMAKPLFNKHGRFTRRVPLTNDEKPTYTSEHFVSETLRWYYPERLVDMEIQPNEVFRIARLKADAEKRTQLALSCVLDKNRFVPPTPRLAIEDAEPSMEEVIVPGDDPERDQDTRSTKMIKVDVADRTVALPYAPREKVQWILDEAKRMYHSDSGEAVNADMLVVAESTSAPLSLELALKDVVKPGASLAALLNGKPARAYVVGKLELDMPIDKIGALDSVTGLRFQAKFKADLANLANIKTSRVQVMEVTDEPEDHCVVISFKLVNDAQDMHAPTPMMALRSLQATLEREGAFDVAAATVVQNSIVDATPKDGADDEQPAEAFIDFEYAGTVAAQAAGAILLLPFAPLAIVGAGALYGADALSKQMDGAVDAGSGLIDTMEAISSYPSLALPSLMHVGGTDAMTQAEDEWESVTDDESDYEDVRYDDDDWDDDDDDDEEETIYSGTTVTGGSWETESLAMSVGERGRRRGGLISVGHDYEAQDMAAERKRRASMLKWTSDKSGGIVGHKSMMAGSDVTGSGYNDDILYDEDYYERDGDYYPPDETPDERATRKRKKQKRKGKMKQWMSTRRFASKLAERENDLRNRPRGAGPAVVAHEIGLAPRPAMSVAEWIAEKTTLNPEASERCSKALNDAGFDDIDALASPYAAITDTALTSMGVELMGERVSILGALDALRAERRRDSNVQADVSRFTGTYGLNDQLKKLEGERAAERAERARQLDEIAELRQLVLAAMIDPEKRKELGETLGRKGGEDDISDDASVATSFFTRAYEGAFGEPTSQAAAKSWFGLGNVQQQSAARGGQVRGRGSTVRRRSGGGDGDDRSYYSGSGGSRSVYSGSSDSRYSDEQRQQPAGGGEQELMRTPNTKTMALKAEQDQAATRLQSISRRRSSQRMVSEKKKAMAETAAANARSPAVTSGQVHGVQVGVTRVRRNFPGFGTFEGLVTAYAAPFFIIVYSDGDEEELPVDEIRELELIDEDGAVFMLSDGPDTAGNGGGGGGWMGEATPDGKSQKRSGSFASWVSDSMSSMGSGSR